MASKKARGGMSKREYRLRRAAATESAAQRLAAEARTASYNNAPNANVLNMRAENAWGNYLRSQGERYKYLAKRSSGSVKEDRRDEAAMYGRAAAMTYNNARRSMAKTSVKTGLARLGQVEKNVARRKSMGGSGG